MLVVATPKASHLSSVFLPLLCFAATAAAAKRGSFRAAGAGVAVDEEEEEGGLSSGAISAIVSGVTFGLFCLVYCLLQSWYSCKAGSQQMVTKNGSKNSQSTDVETGASHLTKEKNQASLRKHVKGDKVLVVGNHKEKGKRGKVAFVLDPNIIAVDLEHGVRRIMKPENLVIMAK